MTIGTTLRRASFVAGGTLAAIALGTTAANAHHCYVPLYSLNGPTPSAQWEVFTAEDGARLFAGYSEPCAGATEAGYDALRAARMPLAIMVNAERVVGDPQHDGTNNPNGADGRGLEYFGEGSTLADEMVMTFVVGAVESCS